MLAQIQEFFSENTTMVIIAVVALVAMVAFVLLRRNTTGGSAEQTPYPTPSHDMEGMETMGSVCDISSGMCQPQDQMQQQEQH